MAAPDQQRPGGRIDYQLQRLQGRDRTGGDRDRAVTEPGDRPSMAAGICRVVRASHAATTPSNHRRTAARP